jgi:MFS family permease
MAIWITDLEPTERRTLWACFGGWALDSFDVNLYALVIPTLFAVLHFTPGEAGVLATVTLLLSAFGGWVTGILSDRFGRVRMLQATILWFAFFTFLSGFANSFGQLFACRALMGLGFGGEWAAGSVLMGEVIRARYRGRAVGTVQSGWAVGWGAATLAFAVIFQLLPPETAWRALFWTGILPALSVFLIRRHVPEPEVFRRAAKREGGLLGQAVSIFSPVHVRATLLASLLTLGAQGGYYAVSTWLPTFLRTERHLSVLGSSGYLAAVIVGAFCGFLTGAWLADRIGRKATFLLFAVAASTMVVLYMLVPIDNGPMLALGFPLGFFANGMFAPMGAYLTELFPTAIRGTAQGFAYNAGRGVGALFPALIGFLAGSMGLGIAIGAFTLGAYALMFLALLALPETRGRELPSDPDVLPA